MNSHTEHPVIDLLEDQKKIVNKGGTMRLGAYSCKLKKNSLAYKVYGREEISERHRHRYEFNNLYLSDFGNAGLVASGVNEEKALIEVVENANHPWFIGVQFHPEYKSTVENPHPLFLGFVKAATVNAAQNNGKDYAIA
jgi:CTP synthase